MDGISGRMMELAKTVTIWTSANPLPYIPYSELMSSVASPCIFNAVGMVIESTRFNNAIVMAPMQMGMEILRIVLAVDWKFASLYGSPLATLTDERLYRIRR